MVTFSHLGEVLFCRRPLRCPNSTLASHHPICSWVSYMRVAWVLLLLQAGYVGDLVGLVGPWSSWYPGYPHELRLLATEAADYGTSGGPRASVGSRMAGVRVQRTLVMSGGWQQVCQCQSTGGQSYVLESGFRAQRWSWIAGGGEGALLIPLGPGSECLKVCVGLLEGRAGAHLGRVWLAGRQARSAGFGIEGFCM